MSFRDPEQGKVIDMGDPLAKKSDFVFAVANARCRGELTDTEWQILIDEVERKKKC